jgi:hypothetical protein
MMTLETLKIIALAFVVGMLGGIAQNAIIDFIKWKRRDD